MYTPQLLPKAGEDMEAFLSDEFNRVAASYNDLKDGILGISYTLPSKVKPGMVKLFDGTEANPLGSGKAGVYYYGEDGQWHFLTDSQAVIDIITPILDSFGIAIVDAVVDAIDAALITARPTPLTPVSLTSGSVAPLLGIPNWANRVHIVLDKVSTTGTSTIGLMLITDGGAASSGYTGSTASLTTSVSVMSHSTNIVVANSVNSSSDTLGGVITLVRVAGNRWSYSTTSALQSNNCYSGAGSIQLPSALVGVAMATGNTFDGGQFTVVYD